MVDIMMWDSDGIIKHLKTMKEMLKIIWQTVLQDQHN
jgi:hypothetical protein